MSMIDPPRYYTGIGSRETPTQVLEQMAEIGTRLAEQGYVLRSGGARGADTAFERGCDAARGAKQIWDIYQTYVSRNLRDWALEKASAVCWEFPLEKMKAFTVSIIVRNMYQVYGDPETLEEATPTDFVVYWAKGNPLEPGRESGGTRYAVRQAHKAGIKTYNLRTQGDEFAEMLRSLHKGMRDDDNHRNR